MKNNEQLLYLSLVHNGDWESIDQSLDIVESINKKMIDKKISNFEGSFLTINDQDYPDRLRTMDKPPFVLYYRGSKKNLHKDNLFIFMNGKLKEHKDVLKKHINIKDDSSKNLAFVTNDYRVNIFSHISADKNKKFLERIIQISESPKFINNDLERDICIATSLSSSVFIPLVKKDKITENLVYDSFISNKEIYTLDIDNPNYGNKDLLNLGAKTLIL